MTITLHAYISWKIQKEQLICTLIKIGRNSLGAKYEFFGQCVLYSASAGPFLRHCIAMIYQLRVLHCDISIPLGKWT